MADASYPKIYREQGAEELVIQSGGALTLESGSTFTDASTKTLSGTETVTGSLTLTAATVRTPNVANANVVGGIPVVHRVDIADSAGDTNVTLTNKTRVIDVVVVKTGSNGGAGDTVTVKYAANAITAAIDLNINDQVIARATSINDAYHEIAAGGVLRVTAAKVTNCACTVYVYGLTVA